MSGSTSPKKAGPPNQESPRGHGTIECVVALRTSHGLIDGLESLAHTLESLDLKVARVLDPLCPDRRDSLVRTVRSYLIPRLSNPEMPLCVVLAGPTGAGKSTLANSLSALNLSETGPIRPTTKIPLVLTAPAAKGHFEAIADIACEIVTGSSPILERVALIDTPDIDSTSVDHRRMAEALIDNADVVVFVTSALRYADEVPWQVLRRAQSRGAPIIHVLNRFSSGSAGALVDMRARLDVAGIEGDVMRIPEHHLAAGAQAIPASAVRELSRTLIGFAEDRDRYQKEVVNRVLGATTAGVQDLADVVAKSRELIVDHEASIRTAFSKSAAQISFADEVGDLLGDLGELPDGSRARRRWLKRSRIDDVRRRRDLTRALRRMAAAIEDDMGALALRQDDLLVRVGVLPVRADRVAARRAIVTELSGWLDFVVRAIAHLDPRNRNLASVVLVNAAVGDVDELVLEAVLGEEALVLVERAARELSSRLGRLYQGAAEGTINRTSPMLGDPAPRRVLESRTKVVESVLFADA